MPFHQSDILFVQSLLTLPVCPDPSGQQGPTTMPAFHYNSMRKESRSLNNEDGFYEGQASLSSQILCVLICLFKMISAYINLLLFSFHNHHHHHQVMMMIRCGRCPTPPHLPTSTSPATPSASPHSPLPFSSLPTSSLFSDHNFIVWYDTMKMIFHLNINGITIE